MAELKPQITYEDFVKLDLRVCTVVESTNHPNADKLLVACTGRTTPPRNPQALAAPTSSPSLRNLNP